jgi:hypothetical protein
MMFFSEMATSKAAERRSRLLSRAVFRTWLSSSDSVAKESG